LFEKNVSDEKTLDFANQNMIEKFEEELVLVWQFHQVAERQLIG